MCVGRVGGGGGGGEALDTLQKTFQKGRSSIFTPCSPSPSSMHVAFALCYHLRTVSALLQLCDLISRQLGFFPSHIQPTFKSEASVAAVAQRTSSQRTTHNAQRTTWQHTHLSGCLQHRRSETMGRKRVRRFSIILLLLLSIPTLSLLTWRSTPTPTTTSSSPPHTAHIIAASHSTSDPPPPPAPTSLTIEWMDDPPPPAATRPCSDADPSAFVACLEETPAAMGPTRTTAHLSLETDYGGSYCVQWGGSHRVETLEQCAESCASFSPLPNAPRLPCNTFTFCPSPRCWSQDIHNHTFGECWLLFSPTPSHPIVNKHGSLKPIQSQHPTAPDRVEWSAGFLT